MLFYQSRDQFKSSTVHISRTPDYITRIRTLNRECLVEAQRVREAKAQRRRAAENAARQERWRAANSFSVQNDYVSVGDYSNSNFANLSKSPRVKRCRLIQSSCNNTFPSIKRQCVLKMNNRMRSTILSVSSKSVPTASVPTTSVPATSGPTTCVAVTSVSATSVPPASVPPTSVPPIYVPPTSVPPTFVPTTCVPPTSVSTTAVPPTSAQITSLDRLVSSNKRASTIHSHLVASTGIPSKMISARKKLLSQRSVPSKPSQSCERGSEALSSKRSRSARMRLLTPSRDVIRPASYHLSSVNHPLGKMNTSGSFVIGKPFSFSFGDVKSVQKK